MPVPEELNELQYAILDALYFVEPYENILADVDAPENIVGAELRQMLQWGWVQAMSFDEASQDYVPSAIWDVDDLRAYRYLASRKGLLMHHGRI